MQGLVLWLRLFTTAMHHEYPPLHRWSRASSSSSAFMPAPPLIVLSPVAQQASNGPQVWALALLSGGVALLGFALVGWIAKAIAPWSKGR